METLVTVKKEANIGLEEKTKDAHNYFSNDEFDKILEIVADDIIIDAVGLNATFHGKQGARDFMQLYKSAFPDIVLKHTNIFSIGNQVAVEFTASGTHTGPLQTPQGEIAATGKSVSLKAAELWVWKDGKIQSIHNYVDTASLLMQLGVM